MRVPPHVGKVWPERKTNEEILSQMCKEKELIRTTKTIALQYLGGVMRVERYGLHQLIIQDQVSGKNKFGNFRKWYKCSSIDIFRAAVSWIIVAIMMITNLR